MNTGIALGRLTITFQPHISNIRRLLCLKLLSMAGVMTIEPFKFVD